MAFSLPAQGQTDINKLVSNQLGDGVQETLAFDGLAHVDSQGRNALKLPGAVLVLEKLVEAVLECL